MKDTWQTFFRVIVRIMKKGYSRQHPGAAIVFVGKGGIVHRSIVPKPLAIDQKNLITEVKYSSLTLFQIPNSSIQAKRYIVQNNYMSSFVIKKCDSIIASKIQIFYFEQ